MIKPPVVKVLIFNPEGKLLILRRSKTHPHYPEHVDFPGGEVEPGENIKSALLREIQEELSLGFELSNASLSLKEILRENRKALGVNETRDSSVYGLWIHDEEPEIKLSWEHSSYEWMAVGDFKKLPIPQKVDYFHLFVLEALDKLDLNS